MTPQASPAHIPVGLIVDADIYDLPGAHDDPQPAWKSIDRGAPGVVWTPRNRGHWIATSARLIWELYADIDRLSASEISVSPGQSIYPMIPNQSDEPEHNAYRRIPQFGLKPGKPPVASSGAVNGMLKLGLSWPTTTIGEVTQ